MPPALTADRITAKQREQSRKCQLCQVSFAKESDLREHRRAMHQRSPPQEPAHSAGDPDGSTALQNRDADDALKEAPGAASESNFASALALPPSTRSQTPQTVSENTRKLSRLNLDADRPQAGPSAEATVDIDKKPETSNTPAPQSKKRPASGDVRQSRRQVQSDHRPHHTTRALRPRPGPDADFEPREPAKDPTLYDPNSPVAEMALAHNATAYNQKVNDRPRRRQPRNEELIRDLQTQLNCNPISDYQLKAEASGLYKSLEIVEQRCVKLDQGHIANKTKEISNEGWRALTALHRTLLYEHIDFLLASQHPSADKTLKNWANERQIPFRLWKYAIHAYLELLRQHLPSSFEFMEAFIYLAYQTMALLVETVPVFQVVWTECLGDLARYRMAIESVGQVDSAARTESVSPSMRGMREVWTGVACYWYTRASDQQPHVGRLYHHLGILARPNMPLQLFYYAKSLCCTQPFANATHSIKAVFETASAMYVATPNPETQSDMFRALDVSFVYTHSLIYETKPLVSIEEALEDCIGRMQEATKKSNKKWKQQGVILTISNISACFSYGRPDNPLRKALEKQGDQARDATGLDSSASASVTLLSRSTHILLSSQKEDWMFPMLHILLLFLDRLIKVVSQCKAAMTLLSAMPWTDIAATLNRVPRTKEVVKKALSTAKINQPLLSRFEDDGKVKNTPLLEDVSVRGLPWSHDYFPKKWFEGFSSDDIPFEERGSAGMHRAESILHFGIMIAEKSEFLHFDKKSLRFSGQETAAGVPEARGKGQDGQVYDIP